MATIDNSDITQSEYYCSICSVDCCGPESYQSHINGKRHKKELERKKNFPRTENREKYYCTICDVLCSSPENFKQHTLGRKHIRLEKRLRKKIFMVKNEGQTKKKLEEELEKYQSMLDHLKQNEINVGSSDSSIHEPRLISKVPKEVKEVKPKKVSEDEPKKEGENNDFQERLAISVEDRVLGKLSKMKKQKRDEETEKGIWEAFTEKKRNYKVFQGHKERSYKDFGQIREENKKKGEEADRQFEEIFVAPKRKEMEDEMTYHRVNKDLFYPRLESQLKKQIDEKKKRNYQYVEGSTSDDSTYPPFYQQQKRYVIGEFKQKINFAVDGIVDYYEKKLKDLRLMYESKFDKLVQENKQLVRENKLLSSQMMSTSFFE